MWIIAAVGMQFVYIVTHTQKKEKCVKHKTRWWEWKRTRNCAHACVCKKKLAHQKYLCLVRELYIFYWSFFIDRSFWVINISTHLPKKKKKPQTKQNNDEKIEHVMCKQFVSVEHQGISWTASWKLSPLSKVHFTE